MEFLQPSIIC